MAYPFATREERAVFDTSPSRRFRRALYRLFRRSVDSTSRAALEPMEPRILLAADLALNYTATSADEEITVRIASDDTDNDDLTPDVAVIQILRIENDDSETLLAQGELGPNNTVSLVTGGGADTVLFEATDAPTDSILSLDLTIETGEGSDRIEIDSTSINTVLSGAFEPTITATMGNGSGDVFAMTGSFDGAFELNGVGAGGVNDNVVDVTFSGAECVEGGTADDVFTFSAAADFSLGIDAGDGDDMVIAPASDRSTVEVTGEGAVSIFDGDRTTSKSLLANVTQVERLEGGAGYASLDISGFSAVSVDLTQKHS